MSNRVLAVFPKARAKREPGEARIHSSTSDPGLVQWVAVPDYAHGVGRNYRFSFLDEPYICKSSQAPPLSIP